MAVGINSADMKSNVLFLYNVVITFLDFSNYKPNGHIATEELELISLLTYFIRPISKRCAFRITKLRITTRTVLHDNKQMALSAPSSFVRDSFFQQPVVIYYNFVNSLSPPIHYNNIQTYLIIKDDRKVD